LYYIIQLGDRLSLDLRKRPLYATSESYANLQGVQSVDLVYVFTGVTGVQTVDLVYGLDTQVIINVFIYYKRIIITSLWLVVGNWLCNIMLVFVWSPHMYNYLVET